MPNAHNLTPFKVGNPGGPGRPKGGISIVNWLRKALEAEVIRMDKDGNPIKKTGADWVALSLMNKAMKGDVAAIREIIDRIDGKVPQTMIQESNPDAPNETIITIRNESDEEIIERFKKQAIAEEMRKNGLRTGSDTTE